ncbi:Crp/Fnr family transcriptional regulator [Actinophytocola oryzae]|uniref:CRP-like cAMP-binding protein n=1 Tax=Actinophytocola oryzae TaxID=502181 RepID=A0A4R7VAW1_9PSEU|nr:Crp/Fnr family transcriptional regulator [Actinophytocola oryzae]TDV46130.1 CRP-like cAMP-binding protein [Actinophytocola oryzae]
MEPPVQGSFLYYLERADREFLLGRATIRKLATGRTLMHEGDPTDHVLVLLSGWVRVYINARDGQVVLFSLCGPGEVIGDLAVLHGWPRTATVDTLHETEFAQFSHDAFLSCLHDRAAVGVALLRQMAVRLRKADGARVGFATMDVAQRVAAFLVRLADLHGTETPDGVLVGMPLTQQDIANSIGGSRRAVARALQTFRERGILVTGRRTFVLSALEVLRRLAGNVPDGT